MIIMYTTENYMMNKPIRNFNTSWSEWSIEPECFNNFPKPTDSEALKDITSMPTKLETMGQITNCMKLKLVMNDIWWRKMMISHLLVQPSVLCWIHLIKLVHNSPHSFVCEVIEYLLQEEKVSVDQNGITDNCEKGVKTWQ